MGPILDRSSADRWRVGTLGYTSAGLAMVVLWQLVGAVGVSIRDRSYASGFGLLLHGNGASNTAFSFLMTILPQGIGVALGPAAGFWSDRFRSRLGRRVPFLLFVAGVGTAAMVGVALTPRLAGRVDVLLGARSPGVTWLVLIVFGAFSALFHVSVACSHAVLSALAKDVTPGAFLGRFFALFRGVSLLCGMVYNFLIIGHVERHFEGVFVGIGLAFGVTVTLMCLMVREGDYPPPEPTLGVEGGGAVLRLLRSAIVYCRECFAVPYYPWVLAALALGIVTGMPVNTYSVRFAKTLGMDMGEYGRWVATNHVCGFLLAYPLGMLVDRFHPLRMSMVTIALYGVTMLVGGLLIDGPRSFGWVLFFQSVASGTYLTTSASLAPALLPRLKFAQYYSASLLLTSAAQMAAALALGALLDRTGSDYRLTYFIGFGLSIVTVATMLVVYAKFMALGGPKGYVAPETAPRSGVASGAGS